MKNKIIFGLILSLIILPLVSFAAAEEQQGSPALERLVRGIKYILNLIIGLLFALATVYFVWGVVQYVVGASGDTQKLEQGKRHMLWGIVGMVIMLGAWGIVRVIRNFLGLF